MADQGSRPWLVVMVMTVLAVHSSTAYALDCPLTTLQANLPSGCTVGTCSNSTLSIGSNCTLGCSSPNYAINGSSYECLTNSSLVGGPQSCQSRPKLEWDPSLIALATTGWTSGSSIDVIWEVICFDDRWSTCFTGASQCAPHFRVALYDGSTNAQIRQLYSVSNYCPPPGTPQGGVQLTANSSWIGKTLYLQATYTSFGIAGTTLIFGEKLSFNVSAPISVVVESALSLNSTQCFSPVTASITLSTSYSGMSGTFTLVGLSLKGNTVNITCTASVNSDHSISCPFTNPDPGTYALSLTTSSQPYYTTVNTSTFITVIPSSACPCPPRYYSTFNPAGCTLCPSGFYCPNANTTSPAPCPSGTYANTNGLQSATECRQCPPGTEAPMPGSTTCTICSIGKFSAPAGSNCSACAPGTFGTGLGQSMCSVCVAGRYSGVFGASTCVSCPAGSFASSSGSSVCTLCVNGTTSSANAVQCSLCTPGRFSMNGAPCLSCPVGSFAATSGSSNCSRCVAGSFVESPGSKSCTNCIAGRFSLSGASICSRCAAGTYNNLPAQSTCIQCLPGSFAGISGDTTCRACSAGRYSNATGSSACAICSIGSFSKPGAVLCAACEAGSTSSPDMSSCVSCPAGRMSAVASSPCSSCQAGTFSQAGATGCSACALGTQSAPNFSNCTLCGPGTASSNPATGCQVCPSSSYAANSGNFECTACSTSTVPEASTCSCPTGTFTAVGVQGCVLCPNGTMNPFDGAMVSTCFQCDAGRFSSTPGASICAECNAGSYSGIGASVCQPCPIGTAQSSTGSDSCPLCEMSTYTSTIGNTGCRVCDWRTTTVWSNHTGCACLPGYGNFNPSSGSCTPCTGNTITSTSGTCDLCPGSLLADKTHSFCQCTSPLVQIGTTATCDCPARSQLLNLLPDGSCPDGQSLSFAVNCELLSAPVAASLSIATLQQLIQLNQQVPGTFLAGCQVCPPGTFTWNKMPFYCFRCADAMTNPNSGVNLTQPASSSCSCLAGYGSYNDVTQACTKCPANTFAPGGLNYGAPCTPCEFFTYSPPGSDSCVSFDCDAGKFCPNGCYNSSMCVSCDAISTEVNVINPIASECTCKPNYGNFNPATGACTKCSDQTYSAGGYGAVCLALLLPCADPSTADLNPGLCSPPLELHSDQGTRPRMLYGFGSQLVGAGLIGNILPGQADQAHFVFGCVSPTGTVQPGLVESVSCVKLTPNFYTIETATFSSLGADMDEVPWPAVNGQVAAAYGVKTIFGLLNQENQWNFECEIVAVCTTTRIVMRKVWYEWLDAVLIQWSQECTFYDITPLEAIRLRPPPWFMVEYIASYPRVLPPQASAFAYTSQEVLAIESTASLWSEPKIIPFGTGLKMKTEFKYKTILNLDIGVAYQVAFIQVLHSGIVKVSSSTENKEWTYSSCAGVVDVQDRGEHFYPHAYIDINNVPYELTSPLNGVSREKFGMMDTPNADLYKCIIDRNGVFHPVDGVRMIDSFSTYLMFKPTLPTEDGATLGYSNQWSVLEKVSWSYNKAVARRDNLWMVDLSSSSITGPIRVTTPPQWSGTTVVNCAPPQIKKNPTNSKEDCYAEKYP